MRARPSPNVCRRSRSRVSPRVYQMQNPVKALGQGCGQVALMPLTHATPVTIMLHPI